MYRTHRIDTSVMFLEHEQLSVCAILKYVETVQYP